MVFFKQYFLPRLIQYLLTTFLGLSAIFFLPRLLPVDPITQEIARYQQFGQYIPPEQLEYIISTLKSLYGLEGTIWQQYITFWRRLFTWDFGPSLARYPVSVRSLLAQFLPWTIGLLLPTLIINWLVGTLVGGIAGYYYRSTATKMLDLFAMVIRPIPYYILALLLLVVFAYLFPVFPIGGGITPGMKITFTFETIKSLLRHAALPMLTLIIGGVVVNFQTMKLFVQTVRSEDYVWYASSAGVGQGIIVFRYVVRNAMLPAITQLALGLGTIFSGALITEMVFAYPGIGYLLYDAITRADYNMIMGISCASVVVVTTSILFVDLLYPLIDPRIRYR